LGQNDFSHGAIKFISGFVGANSPSGLYEPRGLFFVSAFWAFSFWFCLLALGHIFSIR
jgi:hypothetical protein